jgi:hypothetical protein
MRMDKQYVRILVEPETRRLLKIVAALQDTTIVDLLRRLAAEELAKTKEAQDA